MTQHTLPEADLTGDCMLPIQSWREPLNEHQHQQSTVLNLYTYLPGRQTHTHLARQRCAVRVSNRGSGEATMKTYFEIFQVTARTLINQEDIYLAPKGEMRFSLSQNVYLFANFFIHNNNVCDRPTERISGASQVLQASP